MGLLSISRHPNERCYIVLEDGRRIMVGVHQVIGQKVKLHFQADQSIKIYREEIMKQIDQKG